MSDGPSSLADDARDVLQSVATGRADIAESLSTGASQTQAAADGALRSTQASAERAAQHVATTAASGVTDIAVTYADVTAMRTSLGALSRHAHGLAGQALSTTVNPDLLESVVLSPVTGSVAIASLTGAAASLGAFGVGIEVLGVTVGAVVTTYSIADAALSSGAAALTGIASVTGTGLVGAGGVVVTGATAVGRTGWTTVTAGADVVGEALELAVETGKAAVAGAVVVHSVVFLAVSAAGLTLGENVIESAEHILTDPFSAETYQGLGGVWSDAGHEALINAGRSIGMLPDAVYEGTVGSLVLLFDKAGFHDKANLVDTSVVSEAELALRRDRFAQRVPEDWRESFTEPSDLPELFYSMGEVDALGDKDQAVIRVLVKPGDPPAFTLLIPSTKSWVPGSDIPNDITGNLHVMRGDSQLVQTARDALDQAMSAAGVTDTGSVPVMVAGFSQGGIAAGSFAQQFQHDYRIEQVVTIGSPVGNFTSIPAHTQVVSYEYGDDVVPLLDGSDNPARWETIKVEGGKHAAIEYAQAARDHLPSQPNDIALFLEDDAGGLDVTDYYATRGGR